ncbi:MAG: HAD family phosphatase [Saprospiraceae bacterium]|nr:HAD family phosphatase [Saprospiraceae bacterium]
MEGLIFDMDGTMVDNMMVHHHAWQRKLASIGVSMSLAEVKEKVHGVNEEILERLFGDRFTPAERTQLAYEKEAEYRVIFADRLQLVPGLRDFLNQAKENGIPMAIGTAAPPENVDFVLNNLGLRHYFEGIIHARNVSQGKPHPETFLKAADSMNIPAEKCLVFEDSVAGARTAFNAGCKAIIVTTTHYKQEFAEFEHILKFIPNFLELNLPDILSSNC